LRSFISIQEIKRMVSEGNSGLTGQLTSDSHLFNSLCESLPVGNQSVH